jgi:hypothetical protein
VVVLWVVYVKEVKVVGKCGGEERKMMRVKGKR